jgi:hypothetical protein
MTEPLPNRPSAGDVVVGCKHRPCPYEGCRVLYFPETVPFTKNGVDLHARWFFLCEACFLEAARAMGAHPAEIGFGTPFQTREGGCQALALLIGCDMVWSEDDELPVKLEAEPRTLH